MCYTFNTFLDSRKKTRDIQFSNNFDLPPKTSSRKCLKKPTIEWLWKNNTPAFFEELVIDLLVKMGYGGSREDAGKAVGKSGDGGIDGIINEDRLGLDMIYVQAKRWRRFRLFR